jgi:hypothetical protein
MKRRTSMPILEARAIKPLSSKTGNDPVIGFLKRSVLIFAIQAAGIFPLGYLLLFHHWHQTCVIVIYSLLVGWTFFVAWLNQRIKWLQQKPSAERRRL